MSFLFEILPSSSIDLNMREKQRLVVVVVYIKPPETYNWHAPQWWYVGKGLSWLSLQLSGFWLSMFPLQGCIPFLFIHPPTFAWVAYMATTYAQSPPPYFTAKHPKPRRITQRVWRILTSPVLPGQKKLDIKKQTLIVDKIWTSPANKRVTSPNTHMQLVFLKMFSLQKMLCTYFRDNFLLRLMLANIP